MSKTPVPVLLAQGLIEGTPPDNSEPPFNPYGDPDPDPGSDPQAQCQAVYGWVANTVSYQDGICVCTIGQAEAIACAQINSSFLTDQLCVPNYWSAGVLYWSVWNPHEAQCGCPAWATTGASGQLECISTPYTDFWINCSPEAMLRGQCTWNVNKTLGLPDNKAMTDPTQIVSDVVLGATGFVGTALVIALIVMGVKYVSWGMSESSTWNLKGNMKKLLIWLLLVVWSFTIIRVIQYIARGF